MKKSSILFLIVIMIFLTLFFVNINKNNLIKDISKKTTSSVNTVIKSVTSPISVDYLRSLNIISEKIEIEEELADGGNYKRYIASFLSEGNKVYGLLTIPLEKEPTKGFPAIIFNHGYIPPSQYLTTEGLCYVHGLLS